MKTNEQIPCAACESGHYEEIFTQYETSAADGVEISIPSVKLLRCPKCGDELIPPEAQEQIDRAVAEQTEQLTQRELEEMAELFGGDQTQISDLLGLGSKTFHRWLKGHQFPSRSSGFYLRVLAEFPEALEWVRERGWRKKNRVAQFAKLDLTVQFPDLNTSLIEAATPVRERVEKLLAGLHGRRFNPAAQFRHTIVK